MHFLQSWFGIHLSILQFSFIVLGIVLIFHFLIMSKDFRTFVVLGLFGFAGSFGKMMGILLGKLILGSIRGVKIFFEFQFFSVKEIFRAIHDERQGYDDIGKDDA